MHQYHLLTLKVRNHFNTCDIYQDAEQCLTSQRTPSVLAKIDKVQFLR